MKLRNEISGITFIFPLTILLGIIFNSGCVNPDDRNDDDNGDIVVTPADSSDIPGRGFFMGTLPVPGDSQSFEQSYSQSSRYAEFSPVWGKPTPFYNLADDLSGSWGQTFVEQYIRGNGMFPVILVSFIDQGMTLVTPPGLEDATISDQDWRNAYKQAVLDIVRASRPLYLCVGNEVNRWYEYYGADADNPNGFQYYVSLYGEIYDSVKEISPQTWIFCTFAREIVNENRDADLSMLAMFDPAKMDIVVLTSYPYAVQGINRPSDIQDNYYSIVSDYLPDIPFGFSELGWPSIDDFGGEQGQADFIIETASRLTREQGMNLYLFGWAWLYDLDENDHIGLIKRDGTEKTAYEVWKDLFSTGE